MHLPLFMSCTIDLSFGVAKEHCSGVDVLGGRVVGLICSAFFLFV